ncbi:MAG: ATP-binding protein [Sphingosinicella sp.]|uniref:ATP-binding protein n=1 Tax=Sphingosinicella sp. TaxID=1917971 RepID=UPI0040379F5E
MESLTVVDRVRLPPQGSGTVRALSRIGYELEEALADIIDNSIDAAASDVEITLLRDDDTITGVTIADNGRGMDAETLKLGMQFAGRVEHSDNELGTYGLGMKSASFSQCSTMSVITRQGGRTLGSQWVFETIGSDWQCNILDPKAATKAFDALCLKGRKPKTGTLVIWNRLERLTVGPGPDALDEYLSTAMPRLEAHLGLTFHRFLQSGALSLTIVVRHERRPLALPRPVRAHNPFAYPHSGDPAWPKKLRTRLPGVGEIELTAHIWPPGSVLDNFLLGSRKGVEFQGFYFYRNDRLIQTGGWNGVVKSRADPSLSLARVAAELPPGGTHMNVQKSKLQVSAGQAQALIDATDGQVDLLDYLDAARALYRADRRGERHAETEIFVPGQGFPWRARAAATKRLGKAKQVEEIAFAWERLPVGTVFHLDLTETRIVLNKRYRTEILDGQTASGADAPLVKMLLFLLFRDDFSLQRSSRKRQERVELGNALLFDIVKTR